VFEMTETMVGWTGTSPDGTFTINFVGAGHQVGSNIPAGTLFESAFAQKTITTGPLNNESLVVSDGIIIAPDGSIVVDHVNVKLQCNG